MSGITISASEPLRHLPAPPIVFGLVAFALLMTLLFALLVFGKGRPHS